MISIKQLLERYEHGSANQQQLAGLSRLQELLREGLLACNETNWGATAEFTASVTSLLNQLKSDISPEELLQLAPQALELLEQHRRYTTGFFHEQTQQMQTIVAMLTGTIAEISAQSDASVANLQSIERQIQQASSLNDIRDLKKNLASCLAAVREASVQQQTATQATVERLHDHVRMSRPSSGLAQQQAETRKIGAEFVFAFKLQRAEYIRSRFGDDAIDQMLALLEAGLKPALRPADRLMRWKRCSFLMFVTSSESVATLHQRFSRVVFSIGQQYVEVGKNSALLAVGIDWISFPQERYSSLEQLFADVDTFLREKSKESA
ncbi:MAG TPA: diguanylate cyclase [Bryobacteraceae bacterium]|nr:diguanylate cyclase [Bryobacteraceae bacterium]